MSAASDDDYAPVVGLPTDRSSDDDYAVRPASEEEPEDAPARRRPRALRPVQTSGVVWAWAISPIRPGPARDGVQQMAIGLTEFVWDLRLPTAPRVAEDFGRLVWTAQRFWQLQDPVLLPTAFNARHAQVGVQVTSRVLACPEDMGVAVERAMQSEGLLVDKLGTWVCSDSESEALLQLAADGVATPLLDLAVQRRKPKRKLFGVTDVPAAGRRTIERWRAHVTECIHVADPQDPVVALPNSLFYVPPKDVAESDQTVIHRRGIQDTDPVKLVRALSVTQWLRSPQWFTEAVDDAEEYMLYEAGVEPAPGTRGEEARGRDPRRTSIYDAKSRADLVCMSLTRRQFHEWRRTNAVRSINIYSDASPVVGIELQGMIIDVNLHDGSMERITLPGSTLAFGFTDTLSKGVALLWAIWLVAGPSADDVRWFCSLVSSLTTDGGVELHLLEVPDIVDAMTAWIAGAALADVRPLVRQGRRVFRKAMRLAGWSHQKGNLMKKSAGRFSKWPRFLGNMRVLCKTFRNKTYRLHIRRHAKDLLPSPTSLKSFTAGFAKWRYETVPVTLTQLVELRTLCERLDPKLFKDPQDKEEMKRFFEACRDAEFWRWAAASNKEVFLPLEESRRWGMICECPDHVAERQRTHGKKFIACSRIIIIIISRSILLIAHSNRSNPENLNLFLPTFFPLLV